MAHQYMLHESMLAVTGVGPSTYLKLEKKDIKTIQDFLRVYPTRYDDFSAVVPIKKLAVGQKATIKASVVSFHNAYTSRKGLNIQKVVFKDATGTTTALWFRQPFLRSVFKVGKIFFCAGRLDFFGKTTVFKPIEYEAVRDTAGQHTGRIVPYYTQTLNIPLKTIRSTMNKILSNLKTDNMQEYLPPELIAAENIPDPFKTLQELHFPTTYEMLESAHRRLVIEEIFHITYAQCAYKKKHQNRSGRALDTKTHEEYLDRFIKKLPFTLTGAQEKAIEHINRDITKPHPMNRLLLGDVGSGKTVVIAYAAYSTFLNRYRTIIVVPTAALARQHYQTFKNYFNHTRCHISVVFSKTKESVEEALKKTDILITTHAIFYYKNSIPQVGLVVIDEQHKFGVRERNRVITLSTDNGAEPHVLTISATPIPRSLALTLYGATDISTINELPPGRKKVITRLVDVRRRVKAYEWIQQKIQQEQQGVFVICPMIEENEEEYAETKSVNSEVEKLTSLFPHLVIKGLHSKSIHKEKTLEEFRKGSVHILVATTVIEVGIDIPHANIIIIENADRFGLSQLHQLRGRVGRGSEQAYCLLFSDSSASPVLNRLKVFSTTHDGFKLAEFDLSLRGPGDLMGLSQHGFSYRYSKNMVNATVIERIQNIINKLLEKKPSFIYNSLLVDQTIINNQHLN